MSKAASLTTPAEFVEHLRFSKPWRPYQQRAIDEFDSHVADRHFHLVAAPGSGKTVMGLEVVRRLARPALVLTPTLAIREQWVRRLIDDFLPPGFDEIFWLSRDISKPRELTVTTYQSLGAEFRRDDGKALIKKLRELGVSVLVVDEAHHLRAFWWKCLQALKKGLTEKNTDIVALTATPPVDVPQAEWNRYATFCGPIDEEVGVPELVAEGNLCPHQDFVHFSLPTRVEADELHRFERGVRQLMLDLQLDTDFASRLSAFPHWMPEDPLRGYLRDKQDFYLALSIFLTTTAGRLPEEIRKFYPITGIELPELDPLWMQSLLQGLLFDFRPALDKICDHQLQADLKRWEKRTRAIGAIEKSRVVLVNARENDKLLRHSPAKIDSVAAIIDHESSALRLGLRAVILTDYIRREAFSTNTAEATAALSDAPVEKLGVVPIFERLRRMRLPDVTPGILTGSLIVVPAAAEDALRCTLGTLRADDSNISTKSLAHDEHFIEVSVRDSDRQKAVEAITELFRAGEINCLIGTASLLGEGWDAPTLNTLVLASVVGSFVMSNQMRGRAIRIDPTDPDKAANIWHLATLHPQFDPGAASSPASEKPTGSESSWQTKPNNGGDFDTLQRRFDAFHGIARTSDAIDEDGESTRIENGLARLGCDPPPAPNAEAIQLANADTFRLAEDRFAVRKVWQTAIAPRKDGRFLRPVRTLAAPAKIVRIRFSALLGDSETGIRASIRRWMQRRRIRRIAEAIVEGMVDLLDIDPDFSKDQLRVGHTGKTIRVSLPGSAEEIQSCLVRSLAEFYDLFDNPRYLLKSRKGWYAVPELFAGQKDRARQFSDRVTRAIGTHDIIFAHGPKGTEAQIAALQAGLLQHQEFRTRTCVRWEAERKASDL